MFHGISSRDGKQFPNDDPPSWAGDSSPLNLSVNVRSNPGFFVPGYYPVGPDETREILSNVDGVRFGSAVVTKCIDVPWELGVSPPLTEYPTGFFSDPNIGVPCPKSNRNLYEFIFRQIPGSLVEDTVKIEVELGTTPLQKRLTISVPKDWLHDKSVFAAGRNFFFDELTFQKMRSMLPAEFYVVRELEV